MFRDEALSFEKSEKRKRVPVVTLSIVGSDSEVIHRTQKTGVGSIKWLSAFGNRSEILFSVRRGVTDLPPTLQTKSRQNAAAFCRWIARSIVEELPR